MSDQLAQIGVRQREPGEYGCKQCIYSEVVVVTGLDPQNSFGCKVPGRGTYYYVGEDNTCDYLKLIPSFIDQNNEREGEKNE